MTDPKSFDFAASMARVQADRAAYESRAATVRPANKTALFDALVAAGGNNLPRLWRTELPEGPASSVENLEPVYAELTLIRRLRPVLSLIDIWIDTNQVQLTKGKLTVF